MGRMREKQGDRQARTDIRAVERAIDADLPELARQVIRRYLDLRLPETQAFLDRPDGREQHQTSWHQWGIITHTRMFLRHFETDIPRYLRAWSLWEPVNTLLSRTIDGVTRWDLLRISILLHDIGKFGARTRGTHRFHFTHHERLSGEIIRQELDLSRYGLTLKQIEYVALTAEDHFVLGLLRKRAREQGRYDVAFTCTEEFAALGRQIKAHHPDDFVEVGVLFLGDSLSKADPASGPEPAVSQYDVNIQVAHRYLDIALEEPPYNEAARGEAVS